jgi:hypothetical protein
LKYFIAANLQKQNSYKWIKPKASKEAYQGLFPELILLL